MYDDFRKLFFFREDLSFRTVGPFPLTENVIVPKLIVA